MEDEGEVAACRCRTDRRPQPASHTSFNLPKFQCSDAQPTSGESVFSEDATPLLERKVGAWMDTVDWRRNVVDGPVEVTGTTRLVMPTYSWAVRFANLKTLHSWRSLRAVRGEGTLTEMTASSASFVSSNLEAFSRACTLARQLGGCTLFSQLGPGFQLSGLAGWRSSRKSRSRGSKGGEVVVVSVSFGHVS